MRHKIRGFGNLGIGVLLTGALACSGHPSGVDFNSNGYEGFTDTHFALLSSACTISSGNLSLILAANETAYLFKRPGDGMVVVNANNQTGTECDWTPVVAGVNKTITITTTGSGNTVLLDFMNGQFGAANAAAGKTNGGPAINIALGGTTNDTVMIRGGSFADIVTLGTLSTDATKTLISYNPGVNATKTSAARAFPDISVSGALAIIVSAGPGNDIITGQGGPAVGNSATAPGLLSGKISLTVYGGAGDDTITSGDVSSGGAFNTLQGNDGNDLFIQQCSVTKPYPGILASDHIFGGPDTANTPLTDVDTVDYSCRTNNLTITLGEPAVAATGTVAMPARASMVAGDYFTLNDGTNAAVTFAYEAASKGSITIEPWAGGTKVSQINDHDLLLVDDGSPDPQTFEYKTTHGSIGTTWTVTTGGNIVIDVSVDAVSPLTQLPFANENDEAAATLAAMTGVIAATISTSIAGNVISLTNTLGLNLADNALITYTKAGGGATVGVATSAFAGGLAPVGLYAGGGEVVVPIDITNAPTPAAVAALTAVAIGSYGALLTLTAVPDGSGNINLKNAVPGHLGNNAGVAGSANFTTAIVMAHGADAAGLLPLANDGEAGENDNIHPDIENVIGGAGNDVINASASPGKHVLMGMAGNDTLTGSIDTDTLYGGPGNDTLIGGPGADYLIGGDDNDVLQPGAGADANFLDGGGQNCVATAVPVPSIAFVPITAVTKTNPFIMMSPTPAVSSVCSASFAKVSATTNPGNNTLDFSDRWTAVTVDLSGAKLLPATLVAAPTLAITPTAGETDTLILSTVTTTVGKASTYTYFSTLQNIQGGAGNDTLTGDDAANVIRGGNGNDVIYGNGGDDFLYGEGGADVIYGNSGNDYISGGPGADYMFGDNDTNCLSSVSADCVTHYDYTAPGADVPGVDFIDASDNAVDLAIDCGPWNSGDIAVTDKFTLAAPGADPGTINCQGY
jgi:Ca2+-binding RTX toxin-like protein